MIFAKRCDILTKQNQTRFGRTEKLGDTRLTRYFCHSTSWLCGVRKGKVILLGGKM